MYVCCDTFAFSLQSQVKHGKALIIIILSFDGEFNTRVLFVDVLEQFIFMNLHSETRSHFQWVFVDLRGSKECMVSICDGVDLIVGCLV